MAAIIANMKFEGRGERMGAGAGAGAGAGGGADSGAREKQSISGEMTESTVDRDEMLACI